MKIVCNKETKRKRIIKLINMIMVDMEFKKIDIVSKVGFSEGTVRNILNPNYRPDSSITIDQLATICDAIDCEVVLEIRPKKSAKQFEGVSLDTWMDSPDETDDSQHSVR